VERFFRFGAIGGILAARKLIQRCEYDMDSAETSARRERKDAQRNLERVLRAAHELFAEHGADVTMEEVARRAGVGVGTIYRRFPSKEHLFAAVSHAACADMRHCLEEAAEAERDPLLKLRALVYVQCNRGEARAALLDPRPAGEGAPGSAAIDQQLLYDTLHGMLQRLIAEGQRQGALREGDPAALAALCLELLNPRAFHHLARVVGGGPDDVAEQVVRFVLYGLGAR
jgi:AcrR family transcriptional regulator